MRWFVCILLIPAALAWATEQVVLEADGDSYVKYYFDNGDETVYYADDNFGDEDRLRVLGCLTQWDYTDEIAYMHFDFFPLDGYDGTYLIEAQLVFFVGQAAWGEQRVYTAGGPWEEMTITYNNQPPRGAQVASYDMQGGYNYVDLDVGPISPWVDAPGSAHGFTLHDWEQPVDSDCYEGRIYSRETEDVPELRLTFTAEAVEEASWGEIKAQFEVF